MELTTLVARGLSPLESERAKIVIVEDLYEISDFAVQRSRQAEQHRKAGHLSAVLHLADVSECRVGQFGERPDCFASLLS
ncbi:MAG: hypothetical protein QOI58_1490 [Thermoanaerobaculia bacterium]|nr:hypothetical protein [Thermoanaerobaculia bacterium]